MISRHKINAADASCILENFELAVRAHENLGSQPLEKHDHLEAQYQDALKQMYQVLNTVAILDRLQDHLRESAEKARKAVHADGYSFENDHSMSIYQDILRTIADFDATPATYEPLELPNCR